MSALIFLFMIAVIFGVVLAIEAHDPDAEVPRRPLGLIGWLTGGNWPAKIGGGLLVVGCGALLRFALINLDFQPSIKLAAGACTAGLLGLAATLTRIGAGRRAVSLALGGAAFGVAYLTVYAAFALFHYCSSPAGIALLALTAVAAGVYAITRGALSLALLAMVGAYLAPAFAIADPGPATVYGYLAGASLLTLVMVAARGWRPLIHLSFLFTLGGGVFFAWTARYYSPQHADAMLPVVVVLAALHVLMPIVERRGAGAAWIERLDIAYALMLPTAAGLAALLIAPSRASLSNELLALAAVWFAAAGYLMLARRDGAVLHAVIGILLAGSAVAARFRDLPWELIALAFSVIALWLAARRSQSIRLQNALASLVPIAGLLHILNSLSTIPTGTILLNEVFLERLIGAGLLMLAGQLSRSIRNSLDTLLWSAGAAWALTAVGFELHRWDVVSLPVLIHWVFLAAAAYLALSKSSHRSTSDALVIVTLGVAASAVLAAVNAPAPVSWVSLIAAPLILSWLSIRRAGVEPQTRVGRTLAAMTAPAVAGVWAIHAAALAGIRAPQFVFCAVVLTALCQVVLGDVARTRCRDWRATAVHLYAYLFAIPLTIATTFAISRSPWGVALELLCASGLLLLVVREDKAAPLPRWVVPGCVLGMALVIQAQLLRWLGPSGDLSLLDLVHMRFTALVSLLWASLGAVLTIWARRRASRTLWLAGASLMVAAAVKLVLLDFGMLGQLANILAVIAAGIVFLLVGWLAPMPPAAPRTPNRPPPEPVSPNPSNVPPVTPQSTSTAAARSAVRPSGTQPPVVHAQPAPRLAHSATGEAVSDYWDWNTSRPPAGAEASWESRRSDRLIWTIAILALCVLLVVQCRARNVYPATFTDQSSGPPPAATIVRPQPNVVNPPSAIYSPTVARTEERAVGAPGTDLPGKTDVPSPPVESLPVAPADRAFYAPGSAPQIVNAVYASPRGPQLDVTEQLRASCPSSAGMCMIVCANALAGDPDFGIPKECRVSYQCGSRSAQALRIPEGHSVRLICR